MKLKICIAISLLLSYCVTSYTSEKTQMPEVQVCPQSMAQSHKENIRDCGQLDQWKIDKCPGFCQFEGDKNLYAVKTSLSGPELKKIEESDAKLNQLEKKEESLHETNKELDATPLQADKDASEESKKSKSKLKKARIDFHRKIKTDYTKNLKKVDSEVKKEEEKKAKSTPVPILCEIEYLCTFVKIPEPNFTTTKSDEGSDGELSKSGFPQKPVSNNESKKEKKTEVKKLAEKSKTKK